MNEEKWNVIRNFYFENFSIKPELVDLLASSDVLVMSVSGSSNSSISRILEIDMEYVKEILSTVLDFDGWESDLPTNPLYTYEHMANQTYKEGYPLLKEFSSEVKGTFGTTFTDDGIALMFRVCREYSSIARRIENEWV